MFDQETLEELNRPEARRPVLWTEWRQRFELDLHLPLIDSRLSLTPWELLLDNDQALLFHHIINRASPLCHHLDELTTQMFRRRKSDS